MKFFVTACFNIRSMVPSPSMKPTYFLFKTPFRPSSFLKQLSHCLGLDFCCCGIYTFDSEESARNFLTVVSPFYEIIP